jgi:predicted nucleotidyltransferase
MNSKVSVDQERLAEFCRQNGVRRLAIFGSALRDDFGRDSDVDVLIEFEPGRTPGLRFFWMQEELSRLFNRTVDLHTPASLSRYFRSQVLAEAEDQYVAA